MGGYRVQGRTEEAARRIQDEALALEKAGAFSIVLEGMPSDVGADITASLSIPTIGIGAGAQCDAQVLVITDLLGLGEGTLPKFARAYADLGRLIGEAARSFAEDVAAGTFPDDEHSYG
jgi:3-methyl-2-oxobutanoate hydroxymethyltransferase